MLTNNTRGINNTCWVILTLSTAYSAPLLPAHESPLHTIEALNQNSHLTATQLHQRAVAHRASGHLDLAIADLQTTVLKEPQEMGHRFELARTQFSAHKNVEAIRSTHYALMLAQTPGQRAEIYRLQAEIYQEDQKYKKSLALIQRAFQEIPKGELEWYLIRAQNQKKLHITGQRVLDLESGMKANASAVLKSHWIDALLDDSQFQRALKEVDKELVDRRWKSTYLIKRARALIGLKMPTEAQKNLHSAVAEIEPRLNPEKLDLLLVLDLGVAHSLLGHREQSASCLKLLKLHKAPAWVIDELTIQIATER